MPYTFTLTTTIPATAQEIYDAWLDSLSHSEMTGGVAKMSDEIGEVVSAWDNYITGRNLELVPGERIVQSWRTSEFGDEDEDSIITLTLEETDDGTLLTLEHSNVPDEQRGYEEGGWQENYFAPMVAYFTERAGAAVVPEEEPAAEVEAEAAPTRTAKAPKRAAKGAAKRAAKTTAKTAPKRARKTKRAAAAKSKRAAPRTKAAAKTRTTGKARAAAAVKARGRRKPAARKSARGRRR